MNTPSYAQELQLLHDAMIRGTSAPMLATIKPTRSDVLTTADRLAIYTDGYIVRLAEATVSDYPALAHYISKELCEQFANEYAENTPSTYWDLNLYSVAFAAFLKGKVSPAAEALAALESAIAQAFWSPESKTLLPASLATLSEEAFGQHRFLLRNAAKILHFEVAANAYLTAFRAKTPLQEIAVEAEYLLIIRHENEVHRHVLDKDEFLLLDALDQGATFDEALNKANATEALADKLPIYLSRWLTLGVFRQEA